MKISYDDKGVEQKIEARKITIALNDDVDYEISINQFGELVLLKHQYGSGEGSIVLKPSVSNVIHLL